MDIVDAEMEINLDMKTREGILEKINEKFLERDIFREAEDSVAKLLRFTVLPLWMKSPSYRAALQNAKISNIYQILEDS